jgi:uncharacterized protein GlcG (DUF336 family)
MDFPRILTLVVAAPLCALTLGAIGISGGSVDQDGQAANAGASALKQR